MAKTIFRGSALYHEKVRNYRFGEKELEFLSLNMPPECNYNCVGCFSRIKRLNTRSSLNLEEIYNLLDQAKELGIVGLEISGEGEPLMHEERLLNTINYANSLGIITTLFTNGSLLTEKNIEFLAENNVSLALSLDYLDKEKYEKNVCRKNTFDSLMKNMELARDIYASLIEIEEGYRVMRFAIHSIADSTSIHEIPKIKEFCRDDIYYSIAPIANVGSAEKRPELNIDTDDVSKIIRQYSEESIIVSNSTINERGFSICGTFYYGLGISHEGEVLFDAHAFDTRRLIGNVRDFPLTELITKQRRLRNRFYEKGSRNFCPLRDPNYHEFIQNLKEEKNAGISIS